MLLALFRALEDHLHEDGAILDDLEELLTALLGQDRIGDELQLGLVSTRVNLHRVCCGFSVALRQVAVELRVELLKDFLRKTKLAELGKDVFQEGLLLCAHLIASDLDKHGLSLPEVTPSSLAEQKGEVGADPALGRFAEVHYVLEDEPS